MLMVYLGPALCAPLCSIGCYLNSRVSYLPCYNKCQPIVSLYPVSTHAVTSWISHRDNIQLVIKDIIYFDLKYLVYSQQLRERGQVDYMDYSAGCSHFIELERMNNRRGKFEKPTSAVLNAELLRFGSWC